MQEQVQPLSFIGDSREEMDLADSIGFKSQLLYFLAVET